MHDFIFSNGLGVNFTLRTDALSLEHTDFMVLDLVDLSTQAEKDWATKQLTRQRYTKQELIDFATTNNLNLKAVPRKDGNDADTILKQFTLATPANMVVQDSGTTTMDIDWDDVPEASGFFLQRATNVGFTTGVTTLLTGKEKTKVHSYDDTGLTTGTTYYYRVKAVGPEYADSAYATGNDATD